MAFDWKITAVVDDVVTADVTVAGVTRSIKMTGIPTDSLPQARAAVVVRLKAFAAGIRAEIVASQKPVPAAAVLAAVNVVQANEPE